MAPTTRRGKATRRTSKPRGTYYKRKLQKKISSVLEDLPSNSSNITTDHQGVDDISSSSTTTTATATAIATTATSPCSTPKARRFRIPEMDTCPPAPKKQRVISNCSLQRSPIAFFAVPDIELFFFFAHRDISV